MTADLEFVYRRLVPFRPTEYLFELCSRDHPPIISPKLVLLASGPMAGASYLTLQRIF